MSFDWSEYLNLAWELAGRPKKASNQEAKLRSAISRAYYAAYRTARNYLRDNEGYNSFDADNSHKNVIDKFRLANDEKRIEIGKNLAFLRTARNKADYNDRFSDLAGSVLFGLPIAEKIIKDIKSL
jgi:uncharacterized protein (UPF0332 family)